MLGREKHRNLVQMNCCSLKAHLFDFIRSRVAFISTEKSIYQTTFKTLSLYQHLNNMFNV